MKQAEKTSPEKEAKTGSILIELVSGRHTWVDCKSVEDRKQKMKDLRELFTTQHKSGGNKEYYEDTDLDGKVSLIPKHAIVQISEKWVE